MQGTVLLRKFFLGALMLGTAVGGLLAYRNLIAASEPQDPLRLTPAAITLQYGKIVPVPGVASPERIPFDRSTRVALTSSGEIGLVTTLSTPSEIQAIKVYGAARFRLTVKADRDGNWDAIAGLTDLDLSSLTEDWHRLPASIPVTTGKLLFVLTPVSGSSAPGLRELEIWSSGYRLVHKTGFDLLAAMQSPEPPQNGRLYPASPASSSEIKDGAPATFSWSLPPATSDIKRAWLVYELQGAGHWISTVRQVNGKLPLGGQWRFASSAWSQQMEPVDPSWLVSGTNSVSFSAPDSDSSYAVRNVQFLVELDDGSNFVSEVQATPSSAVNTAYSVRDGDPTTGWSPYPSDVHSSVTPSLTLLFDKPTTLEGVSMDMVNTFGGKIEVSFLQNGAWANAGIGAIVGQKLGAGWNQLPIYSKTPIDGIRLDFMNGEGSAAEILEVVPWGSGVGYTHGPYITLGYPDAGQYYGRTAYLRGFVAPYDNGSGPVKITAAGKVIGNNDGAYEGLITKDEAGFGDSADSDPWSVTIVATWPDGKKVTRTVLFNQYSDAAATKGAMTSDQVARAQAAARIASLASRMVPVVNPYILIHDEAILELDPDAMKEAPSTLSISSLTDRDLPPLDPGMTNVTRGPRAGYRFLPHGKHFLKKVKLSLPYDEAKLPSGMTVDDIKTYYFDTAIGHWRPLERQSVDTKKRAILSLTDHFTDMINATVTVPEYPQPASFNPTQIKDIKAADPSAEIGLIEPPQANNMGDARLSYPIELPPGRNGMQPQLAIQYNSSGGNSWLGVGWDLSIPSITLDTRWGAPRFDTGQIDGTARETETYLLNGEQLTPVAHRGTLKSRSEGTVPYQGVMSSFQGQPVKVYHSRVEGAFQRIVRHGDSPTNYWWEVTDKSGTRYLYGSSDGSSDTSGEIGSGTGIARWMLRRVIDTHGNTVTYDYAKVCDTGIGAGTCDGGVPGYQLYVSAIHYTGNSKGVGPYEVVFHRQTARRPDIIIDGRNGFKEVTAARLGSVTVKYRDEVIRRYKLIYEEGTFHKSRLKELVQLGRPDGKDTIKARHVFTYYDDVPVDGEALKAFAGGTPWRSGTGTASLSLKGHALPATILGGEKGHSEGSHGYIGIGYEAKAMSGGESDGSTSNSIEGMATLVDMDGDGLPDKVYKGIDGRIDYERNPWAPGKSFTAPQNFVANTDTYFASGLSQISKSRSVTSSSGVQGYADGFAGSYEKGRTITTANSYLTDVNGDGIPDEVTDSGVVLFGYKESNGTIAYTSDSAPTGVPVRGSKGTDMLPDLSAQRAELERENPLLDAVRRWVAPYSGVISITGAITLKDSSAARQKADYKTADGVRVTIQRNGTELWSSSIPIDKEGVAITPDPAKVGSLTIHAGDHIYFRVQSVNDGAYDDVSWQPQITYVGKAPFLDANNLDVYSYQAGKDFTLTGRRTELPVPYAGTLRLTGKLLKRKTTDDVALQVTRITRTYDSDGKKLLSETRTLVVEKKLPWNSEGTFGLRKEFTVAAKDAIEIRFKVDSPIDATAVSWSSPQLYYIQATQAAVSPKKPTSTDTPAVPTSGDDILPSSSSVTDAGTPVAQKDLTVQDTSGNWIYQIPVTYDMDLYPNDGTQTDPSTDAPLVNGSPKKPWVAPRSGVILVVPTVAIKTYPNCEYFINDCTDFYSKAPDGDVVFTAKRRGELLAKKIIQVRNQAVVASTNGYPAVVALQVNQGDELFFDFTVRESQWHKGDSADPNLSREIASYAASAEYGSDTPWHVPLNGKTVLHAGVMGSPLLVVRDGPNIISTHVFSGLGDNYADVNLPVREGEALYFDFVSTGSAPIHYSATDTYPGTPPWIAPKAGEVRITPRLKFKAGTAPTGDFLVKVTRNGSVQQRSFHVQDGKVILGLNDALSLNVAAGDTVISEFSMDYPLSESLASKGAINVDYLSSQSWTVPEAWAGNLTNIFSLAVRPALTATGTLPDGRIWFLAYRNGTAVAEAAFTASGGRLNAPRLPLSLSAGGGDTLTFSFVASSTALASAIQSHSVNVSWASYSTMAPSSLSTRLVQPISALHIHMPVKAEALLAKPSVLHWSEIPGAFPVRYRGWGAVGYNVTDDNAKNPRQLVPLKEGDFVLPSSDKNPFTNGAVIHVFPAFPDAGEQRWVTQDTQWGVSDWGMTSSRKGIDYIDLPVASDYMQPAGTVVRAPRISDAPSISWSAGYWFSYDHEQSDPTKSLMDLVDLNGDRYPDVVGTSSADFTLADGSLESKPRMLLTGAEGIDSVRRSTDSSDGISMGPLPKTPQANESGNPNDSTTNNPSARFDPPTISVGFSNGKGDGVEDLVDVNGDGLPDRVYQADDGLLVALNLGYGFAPKELWSVDDGSKAQLNTSDSDTKSFSFSPGELILGWGTFDMSFSGGDSMTTSHTNSTAGLVDVNGDGWADYVFEKVDPTTHVTSLMVALNEGGRFAAPQVWEGAVSTNTQKSQSVSNSSNVSMTVCIPLPPVGVPQLIITRGKTWNNSVSRTKVGFVDINGDGYVDSVSSSDGSNLNVSLNRARRTNLLHTIRRPLGATITLDYKQVGNTYAQPQARWVLSKVTTFDGVANDTPAPDAGNKLGSDYHVTTFSYGGGYYHRFEREFLGFSGVTQTQFDTSGLDGDHLKDATPFREVVQSYANGTAYQRGLLLKEVTYDARPDQGHAKKLVTLNDYGFRDVTTNTEFPSDAAASLKAATDSGAPVFPYLKKTVHRFFEDGEYRATYSEYEYDALGNVTLFHDAGDSDISDDDVFARITYTGVPGTDAADCATPYIVGKPASIRVGAGPEVSHWRRRREADFDCTTGDATTVRIYTGDSPVADTHLTYNGLGNLVGVAGPKNLHGERMRLHFTYDSDTHTQVTRVDNLSFGYSSTAAYDPKWGKPTSTTDINGQTIGYTYDDLGRLETVRGPLEAGTAKPTLQFEYHPYLDFTQAPFASWAKTSHYDRDNQDNTLDTLLFADGLKRVLQTKKDATVGGHEVMIVSGWATVDPFGRTIRQYYPTTEAKGSNGTLTLSDATSASPVTQTTYDALDRVLETIAPDGSTTTMTYGIGEDAYGRDRFKTTVTDAKGNAKTSYRDTRQLITTVAEQHDGATLTTRYAYDRLKEITDVVDTKGNLTHVTYDRMGRRTGIDNPDTGLVTYSYDPAGDLTEKMTPDLRQNGGVGIHYDYDYTRLSSITYPVNRANNVYYEYGTSADSQYHQVGRVKKLQYGGGVEERRYDKLGNVNWDQKTLAEGPDYRIYVTQYGYDSFARLLTLTLPDGEVLKHHYDAGGNLRQIIGTKKGVSTHYLESLTYDAFEQRRTMKLGNGIETRYSYDPTMRRLCRLQSGPRVEESDDCAETGDATGDDLKWQLESVTAAPDGQFQNLYYVYDKVGNILGLGNAVQVPRQNELGGPATQVYDYDDLYRLTSASGVYHETDRLRHEYTLGMSYDEVHNITHKTQTALEYNGDKARTEVAINYDWAYGYASGPGTHPHAPVHIGERTFFYDADGNQLGWDNDQNGTRRRISWDEEDRIMEIRDPGNTLSFLYDDQGQRTRKKGQHGETVYVNQYYSVKNGAITSKHVFAGMSRIASRVITAEQAPRTRDPGWINDPGIDLAADTSTLTVVGDTTATATASLFDASNLGDGAGNQGNQGNHGQGQTNDKTPPGQAKQEAADTTGTDGFPGQGLEHRSARADEVAQNTYKNPNLTGIFPGQGLEHRSDNADAHAQNTEKNPHLNGRGSVGGGTSGGSVIHGIGNGGNGNGSGSNGNGSGSKGGGNGNSPHLQGADFLYYYHPDHLGSTGYVTDEKGELYETLLYLPFGETWEEQASNTWRTPYQYTAKEMDPETGLYYYGARYYDPRTSVWQSADAILSRYLPNQNGQVAGMGGVFNPLNLSLYSYAYLNPVVFTDPDGNETAADREAGINKGLVLQGVEKYVNQIIAANHSTKTGNSYVYGGKNVPFLDCSGYAEYMNPALAKAHLSKSFVAMLNERTVNGRKIGVRGTEYMYFETSNVNPEQIIPGDLAFFNTPGKGYKTTHVATVTDAVIQNGELIRYRLLQATPHGGKEQTWFEFAHPRTRRDIFYKSIFVGFRTYDKSTDPARPPANQQHVTEQLMQKLW